MTKFRQAKIYEGLSKKTLVELWREQIEAAEVDWLLHAPLFHNVFETDFDRWRYYNDGTEAGATALENENTDHTSDVSSGNTQLQLRARIQEIGTGTVDGASTDDYGLEYSKNAGTYTAVTASSANVRIDAASSLTDTAASTNRLTAGSGSFVAGEQEAGNGVVEDHLLTGDDYTNHVWGLEVVAADVANADTLDFRITLNAGAPGMTETVTPRITITKTVALAVNYDAWGIFDDGTDAAQAFHRSGNNVENEPGTIYPDDAGVSFDFVLRFRGQETGGTSGAGTDDHKLQYRRKALGGAFGSWADVTNGADTYMRTNTSSAMTDTNATTQRLSAGTGGFQAGVQEDGNGEVTNYQIVASKFFEHAFAVSAQSAGIVDGDIYEFRVLLNGAVTGVTYTATPKLLVLNDFALDHTEEVTGTWGTSTTITDTLTTTLTAVDRSFLFSSVRGDSNRVEDLLCTHEILNTTTVEWNRFVGSAKDAFVVGHLIEASAGCIVDSGIQNMTTASNDVVLTNVTDISRAFVIYSMLGGTNSYGDADSQVAYLWLNGGVPTLRIQADTGRADCDVQYQVVQLSNITVQRGSILAAAFTGTSVTDNITTVAADKAFVSSTVRHGNVSVATDITSFRIRGRFNTLSQLIFERDGAADDPTDLRWEVVEFTDVTAVVEVLGTTTDFSANGDGTNQNPALTISPSLTATTKVACVVSHRGCWGTGAYATNDYTAESAFTMSVASISTVTVARNSSWGTATFSGFVIEFEPIFAVAIDVDAWGIFDDGTDAAQTFHRSGNNVENEPGTIYTDDAGVSLDCVLRFRFQETGGNSGPSTDDFKLQYRRSVALAAYGSWTDVTNGADTYVRTNTASAMTDTGATTQRLSAGSGGFQAGVQEDGNGEVTNYTVVASKFTELAFAVAFQAAVVDMDRYEFRILKNGLVDDMTYTVTPVVMVLDDFAVKQVESWATTFGAAATAVKTLGTTLTDIDRAFVTHGWETNNNSISNDHTSSQITSTTQVTFERFGSSGTPRQYAHLVEGTAGIVVERGKEAGTNGAVEATTLSNITDIGRAFVIWSQHNQAGSFSNDEGILIYLSLVAGVPTLNIKSQATNAENDIEWQVIQMSSARVQRALNGAAWTTTTDTAAITAAASADTMFINISAEHGAATTTDDIRFARIRADLNSSTQIGLSRYTSDVNIDDWGYEAVELVDGATVKEYTVPDTTSDPGMPAGRATDDVTISAVTIANSFIIGSYRGFKGEGNSGAGDLDLTGEASFTFEFINTTTVRVTRGSSNAEASVTFYVVDFSLDGHTSTGAQTLPGISQAGTGAEDIPGSGAQTLAAVAQAGTARMEPDGAGAQTLGAMVQAGTGAEEFLSTGAQALGAVTQVGTANSNQEHTSTGAQTLPAATQAGTGAEEFISSGAQTLAAMTQAATARMEPDGVGAQTLGAMTQAGTGAEEFIGSGAQTLGAVTQAATARMEPDGVGAQTLGAMAQAGTGAEEFISSGAQTLAAVTQAATAESNQDHTSTAAQTLAALTQAGTGAEEFIGSGAQTLAAVTQAATARMEPDGAGAQILAGITQVGTGEAISLVDGSGAQTLPAATQAGTGAEEFLSSGAQTLAAVVQAGTGAEEFLSTGVQTLAAVVQAGTGAEEFLSTGAQTLAAMTQAGTAEHTVTAHTGSGAQTLAAVAQAGTGAEEFPSTGAQTLAAVAQAGTGAEEFPSTGAQTLAAVAQAGTGAEEFPSTGAQTLPAATQAGTGAEEFIGTGAQTLAAVMQAGTGVADVFGAGAQTLPAITQQGTAEEIFVGSGRVTNFVGSTIWRNSATNTIWNVNTRRPALRFDGIDDYVSMGDVLGFEGTAPFSVEAWFRFEQSNNTFTSIIEKQRVSVRDGWEIAVDVAESNLIFSRYVAAVPDQVVGGFTTGQDQHVAATYDGVDMRVYINGALKDTAASSASMVANGDDLELGRLISSSAWSYGGTISDVRIWNDVRTQQEILDNMHGLLTGAELGLVGWWPMDEGSGLVIEDKSPNNNDGTLENGVLWDVGPSLYGITTQAAELQLSGVVSGIDVGDGSEFQFGTGDFTLEMSFRIDTFPVVGDASEIMGKRTNLYSDLVRGNFELQVDANHKLEGFIDGHGPGPTTIPVFKRLSTILVQQSRWHHAALVRKDGIAYMYLDVREFARGEAPHNVNSEMPLEIGKDTRIWAFGEYFHGAIREARLWNIARSPEELLAGMDGVDPTLHGLVGYWKLDDGAGTAAIDSSENNDGVIAGGTWVTGTEIEPTDVPRMTTKWARTSLSTVFRNGSLATVWPNRGIPALSFNGLISDYVSLPHTVINGATDLTVEFVVLFAAIGSHGVVSCANSVQNNELLVFPIVGGANHIQVYDAGVVHQFPQILSVNQYYHMAVVRDYANGLYEVFVDGVSLGQKTASMAALGVDLGGFLLGQEQDNVGGGFHPAQSLDGLLFDFRFWNTARTQAEIQANIGKRLDGDEVGLAGYWKFGEGFGPTVFDSTVNARDGTIIGASWVHGLRVPPW